jgi:hypothetical protein
MLANLSILRVGNADRELTRTVQTFLRGRQLYLGEIDGIYGPKTAEAVRRLQAQVGLHSDGIVGNMTWGVLLSKGAIRVLPGEAPDDDRASPNWPPKPKDLRPLTPDQKMQMFGRFAYEPAPTATNPEAIRIVSRSPEFRTIFIEIPELEGIQGAPKDCRIEVEDTCAEQFKRLFKAWKEADLLHLIHTWAGTYVPRFVRGSRTRLSSHAWGSALDINVPWNMLGSEPALVGRLGSVRELVPIANELGFYWGGHFSTNDGMHFEVARVQ